MSMHLNVSPFEVFFYCKSAHVNSNFCWGSSLHILYSDESVTFVSVVEQKVCSFGT